MAVFGGNDLVQIAMIPPATESPTGATQTLDLEGGVNQVVDLSGATTTVDITLSNARDGSRGTIRVIQHATTPQQLTWANAIHPGGSSPTISSGASAVDLLDWYYDGSAYLVSVIGQDYS